MASAEGYLAGDSTKRFRRYFETVKESGICWFESNNGHQLAGSVNTFTDSRLKKCVVLSKGFLASKSKPDFIPFRWHAVPFKSGKGGIRSAPRPYTGSGVKPSFSRRSLWVNLKPCRKRDEVV